MSDEAIDRAYRIVTMFMDAERRIRDTLTHDQRQSAINEAMEKRWGGLPRLIR